MRIIYLMLATAMLCACAAPTAPKPLTDTVLLFVREDPALLGEGELGRSIVLRKRGIPYACHIVLRKYPQCLQHEVRHCLEGNWHEGQRHNAQDCN